MRYALDALPDAQDDSQARRRIESLVEGNLGSGRVWLSIETREGLRYTVGRVQGEPPVVLDSEGNPTEIMLKSGGVFAAAIYSQNEVEAIADRPLAQLELIDGFEAEAMATVEGELRQVLSKLQNNAFSLLPLQEQIGALQEEVRTLPAVESKLQALIGQQGNTATEINEAHARRNLRDRQTRVATAAKQAMTELKSQTHALAMAFNSRLQNLVPDELLAGSASAQLRQIQRLITDCMNQATAGLQAIEQCLQSTQRQVEAIESEASKFHAQDEQAFQELLRQQQAQQGQAAERAKLERHKGELEDRKRELQLRQGELQKLRSDRQKLLEELSELRDRRFQLRQKVAQRITGTLQPTIRASVEQAGNLQAYEKLLADAMQSNRLQQNVVARKIAKSIPPVDLAQAVRAGNVDALIKAELSAEQAQKALAALDEPQLLLDLEIVELADLPRIELKDGDSYKDSTALSTGQKCTVILPILLLDSQNPLLVDQPEDNLDNSFICDTIVETISRIKQNRQLIFVTHNPNIPVLGDAQRLFVLDSDGSKGRIKGQGTVDECRDHILTLLEGGEEAFQKRGERYGTNVSQEHRQA